MPEPQEQDTEQEKDKSNVIADVFGEAYVEIALIALDTPLFNESDIEKL